MKAKIISIAVLFCFVVLISFFRVYVLYGFNYPFKKFIWYGGFLLFVIPIFIILKVIQIQNQPVRILFIFLVLIIMQMIADILLIKLYFGEGARFIFFDCMANRWEGDIVISLLSGLIKPRNKRNELNLLDN